MSGLASVVLVIVFRRWFQGDPRMGVVAFDVGIAAVRVRNVHYLVFAIGCGKSDLLVIIVDYNRSVRYVIWKVKIFL